jgi:hypothetical protein
MNSGTIHDWRQTHTVALLRWKYYRADRGRPPRARQHDARARELRALHHHALRLREAATLTADKFAEAAEILSLSEDYRVLRRFVPRDRFLDTPSGRQDRRLRRRRDDRPRSREAEVIELGMVPFYFDPDRGQILQVILERIYAAFEEPKGEVSAEITEITGIEPEMLIGQRIDDDRVNSSSSWRPGHRAQRRVRPPDPRAPAAGVPRQALGLLAARSEVGRVRRRRREARQHPRRRLRRILRPHRALDDARVGVHVLAHQRPCDAVRRRRIHRSDRRLPVRVCVEGIRSPFSDLLQSARMPTLRIYAATRVRREGEAQGPQVSLVTRRRRPGPKSWFRT